MYSTSFNPPLRYVVVCIANATEIIMVDAVVDTGARYTCFRANTINPMLLEKDFIHLPHRDFGGFVDGKNKTQQMRFYQYHLKQFTIGNIDMGVQDIWITFDTRISDNVLGMDILQSIDFLQYRNTGRIIFFQNKAELVKYVTNDTKYEAYREA
ncbi:MAG: retropepsin-like domain-containing protein [Selenomonadaceae bacterium]|nr:retropepsin-like domain-containing protein [Selenomonadaceae bacterium]